VLHCPLTGCTGTPEKLFEFMFVRQAVGVYVTGGNLYYAAWPYLGTCPTDDCASGPTNFTSIPALGVAANATNLFVTRNGGLTGCSADGCTDRKDLAQSVAPFGVAIDEKHVYFSTFDYMGLDPNGKSSIMRCPLEGCGTDDPDVVKSGDFSVFNLAVNDTRIFFTNINKGSVVSLAKPR